MVTGSVSSQVPSEPSKTSGAFMSATSRERRSDDSFSGCSFSGTCSKSWGGC
ncbi:Uncharacterised protein [Mycobacteroides abscessus subsp. abscessus]|nr:Uncharacterised protein [Mycobacteroides abscessus subsp. abscessus]